jgi:hypothetical protein
VSAGDQGRIVQLVAGLRDVFTTEGAALWLEAENAELDGECPRDLIRRGEFDRVLEAVERLMTGSM